MIIDCCVFLNEYDMLEARFEYLDDIVDRFIVIEGDTTYSGNRKPYNLLNSSRFKKWQNKIVFLPFTFDISQYNFSEKPDSLNTSHPAWRVESEQINHVMVLLSMLKDDTIVMFSDVDEIPRLESIRLGLQYLPDYQIAGFEQRMFQYNVNTLVDQWWIGTIIAYNKVIMDHGMWYLKTNKHLFSKLTEAGWHLSYFFSPENIQYKIQSFSHQEFNKEQFTNLNTIKQKIQSGENLFGPKTMEHIENPKVFFDDKFYEIVDRIFDKGS